MSSLMLAAMIQVATVGATADGEYKEAYQASQTSGKPLVVLVGTDWCPGCKQMKGRVLPELGKRGVLRRVAFARIDSDQQSKLARTIMSGGTIPQLILYHKTPRGWKRQQLTGAHSADAVEAFLEKGISLSNVESTETTTK